VIANGAIAVLLTILLGFVAVALLGLVSDCVEYLLVTIDERVNARRSSNGGFKK
jgi:hypothetical protein